MKTVLLSGICALTGVLLGTAVSDLAPNARGDSETKEFSTNSPPSVELGPSEGPIPSHGTEGGRQSKVKSRIELRGGQIHVATEQNFGALAETVTGIEVVSDSGRPIHEQLYEVALQGETSRTDSLDLPPLEDGYYIVRSSTYAISEKGEHANYIAEIYLVVTSGKIAEVSSLEFNDNSDINKAVRQ